MSKLSNGLGKTGGSREARDHKFLSTFRDSHSQGNAVLDES